MTEPEYRQDDRTDQGYCPKCGAQVTTVFVDGAGWCPDHGRVWCDWTPPRTKCEVCKGHGDIWVNWHPTPVTCGHCYGTGYIDHEED